MNELHIIADTIEKRVLYEMQANAANRAIAGGYVVIDTKGSKQVWITNRENRGSSHTTYNITGQITGTEVGGCDTLNADPKTEVVTSKNSYWGRQLLENFCGEFSFNQLIPRKKLNYTIHNSFKYEANGSNIQNIYLGTPELGRFKLFSYLSDLRVSYAKLQKFDEEEKLAKQKLEAIRIKEEEERKAYQLELEKIKSEQEAKLLEEKRAKEEQELLEELRLEEERIRKIEEERKDVEKSLKQAQNQYETAVKFIRQQAELRNNPILDKAQNQVKFSHLFDKTTVIIDGGPGTGKTTTLIQRLKFLINRFDLEDYMANSEDLKLSAKKLDIVTDNTRNWIFFSPTDLLCKYLRSNMEYEGLINPGEKTKVWKDYLRLLLRDQYFLIGQDYPFDNKRESEIKLFKKGSLQVVKSFNRFYIKEICDNLINISQIDSSTFSWKMIGKIIISTCEKAKDIKTADELIKLLFQLEDLKSQTLNGKNQSVTEIVSTYAAKVNFISTSYIAEFQKDKQLYQSLLNLVASWEAPEEIDDENTMEEDEELNEEIQSNKREFRLHQYLKSLIKRLALKSADNKTKISGRSAELLKLVDSYIRKEELLPLGEQAFFVQKVYPAVKGAESILLTPIPRIYKKYRKSMSANGNVEINAITLKNIIEKFKNRALYQQEQSLLLGFINNLILTIHKVSVPRFDALKHKYAKAYKEFCRPIIGIDEATDYTLYDYYAISSLRHFSIHSFTLTGDLMQCLNDNGITNWNDLNNPIIFPKLDITELKVSYRQSSELIKLADHLYQSVMNKPSPYKCNILEEDPNNKIPKPLWYLSDEDNEKADWIVDRVLEVKRAYGIVPSIAIFCSDEGEIIKLKKILDLSDALESEGIEVVNCSDGRTDANRDTIRIYPLDIVKGMEFEVVFFHDIHKINNTSLLDKYLYVGLSRASFYMGVTSGFDLAISVENILDLFTLDEDWKN